MLVINLNSDNEKDRLIITEYEKHYLQKQKLITMIQKNKVEIIKSESQIIKKIEIL